MTKLRDLPLRKKQGGKLRKNMKATASIAHQLTKRIMGRNSKKNKGRKPAAEQGLKEAASLASSSANVATAPAHPARTAKHKIRKFPSPPTTTTTTSTQVNDNRTVKGLKETQPVLAPHNTVKQDTHPLVGPSTTPTPESLRTRTAIVTESAVTVSSSHEKEIALHQPITTNLSDSYDSSSASSSETEMCVQDDDHIPTYSDNVAEMQKIEQIGTTEQAQRTNILQQINEKPKDLVAEEYTNKLLVAMERNEDPQRTDSRGHTSGMVAIPDVAGPFTTPSPSLHQKLEAEVTEYLIGNASRAQADEANISFGGGAEQMSDSPLPAFHPDKDNEVPEVLGSCIKMETTKQTAGKDRSSAPAVVGRKEDTNLVNAEPDVREQSNCESETILFDALITSSTPPNNLKQKHDKVQELEIVLDSFDKELEEDKAHTPAEKYNEPAKLDKEIESTRDISAHQRQPSGATHNVVQEPLEKYALPKDTNEETRQVNVCCGEEPPQCSIQESASSNVDKQLMERKAQEVIIDTSQVQEREMSELGPLNEMLIQPFQPTDSHPSLESEQGQTPIVQEQHIHSEVEQGYAPKDVKRENSGTVGIDKELQPLTDDKESTTSIHSTTPVSPEDIITDAQQNIQESHAENLSISENVADEAHETKEENSLVSQILEQQEDVDVRLEARSVVAATCEMHTLLSTEQYTHLVEPEVKTATIHPTSDCQETPDQIYIDSTCEEHSISSVDNDVEKVEMAETEVKDLELQGQKNCQDEQPDDLDRGTVFEGHATESVGNEMEKLECIEVQDNSISVDQEGHLEEKPGGQKTTDTSENDMKKPDEGVSQAVGVTLDKNWDSQEEKPDQVYNDSVCTEHQRSLENAGEEIEAGQSEETIVVEEEKAFEEKLSQLDDIRKCAQEKPEVEALELASATPDGSYVCKEETHLVENQQERELEVGDVALHEHEQSPEEEHNQPDRGIACEGHTTNSADREKDNFPVGEPEVKDRSLDIEDYLQGKPDDAHAASVCQEHDSPENVAETVAMGEPPVGGITLPEHQKCKENEPHQQLDRAIEVKSMETDMEESDMGQLDEDECLQEKTDHAHCGLVCLEDRHTESLEKEMNKSDVIIPAAAGGDKDLESPEENFAQQLDRGTICEEHATNFTKNEREKQRESEADLNKQECQEENSDQAHSGSVCEEPKAKVPLENVKKLNSEGEDVTLHQAYQEEKPDQVDRETVCQEHNIISEKEIEKLDVEELGIATVTEEASVRQERQYMSSAEEEMEQTIQEVEIDALKEKTAGSEEITGQVGDGYVGEENDRLSTQKIEEKPEVGEPDIKDVAIQEETESQEDQLERLIASEEHAEPSLDMEKAEVEKPEVAVNKEKCQEEEDHEADVGSVREEHQQTHFLEDALEMPDVGESQVSEHRELQAETPVQVDTDSACQEHSTSSMENEIEKLEIESVTLEEIKESPEEISECVLKEQEVTKELEKTEVAEPEVEGVSLPREKEIREDELDQLTRIKEDAKTCIDSDKEKLEGAKPGVALDKDECKEEKHGQADDGSLYEEHQQTDQDKDDCKEEKHYPADEGSLCEEHQQTDLEQAMEGVKLDKELEPPEQKSDHISSDSEEHPPTSHSTGNENEVGELETAIALEVEKEVPKEYTTKSVEDETEQPKLQVESVILEEKKESPNEMQDQINSDCEGEENGLHSVDNELEKLAVGEAEMEGVALHKETDSQEEEAGMLEVCNLSKEDAKDSIEIAGNPDLKSTVLDKEDLEGEKHCQALDEDHQVAEFQENALENPTVEEPHVGVQGKQAGEEEKDQQADDGSVSEQHQARDLCEGALETPNVENPTVEEPHVAVQDKQAGEEEKDQQADDGSVSEQHQARDLCEGALETPNVENPTVEEPHVAVQDKQAGEEEKDQQADDGSVSEQHQARDLCEDALETPHVENPTVEEPHVGVQDKQAGEEEKDQQADDGSVSEQHQARNLCEDALETPNVENPTVEEPHVAVQYKQAGEEEKDQQADDGSVSEQHQARDLCEDALETPNVENPTVEEPHVGVQDKQPGEEEKDQQADDGSVSEQHQARDLCEDALETPNVGEHQVKGIILDKDQEYQEDIPDQVSSDSVSQEEPTSSMKNEIQKLEVESSNKALTIKKEKGCQEDHTTKSVDNAMDQPSEGKLHSVENEPEEIEVGELEVAGDAQKALESETEMPEAGKPEVNSTTALEEEEIHDQADSDSVCEEHQVTEHAVEKPDVGEPQVESVGLDEDQEPPEGKSDQVDRETVCQEHPTNSVEGKLEVGECQIAIGVQEDKECQEERAMESGMQQPTPEIESTTLEEKKESSEQMLDQVDGSNKCQDNEISSVVHELANAKMGEAEVESVRLHKKQESQEDQLEELDKGAKCEVHTETSVENAIGKPEINDTTLDREGKNDQADSHSACEKHQMTDFPQIAMENPAQAEGANLDKEQELPEEIMDQVCNESACIDATKRENTEVVESEAAIPLHKEEEYQEHLCQLNVCDEQSMSPPDIPKEKPEVKEPKVEIALLEKTEEYQEETSDQVESDCVHDEHETKSMEVSQMEEPELEDVALYQRNESKGEADEVSSSSPNEELITNSVDKDLERLEVDETQVGLAPKKKEDCQPNQADHNSSVCEEQAPTSAARELELAQLEEPEAGVKISDKTECQGIAIHQKNENEESEADKDGAPIITDSGETEVERFEVGRAQVGIALQEMENCQADKANSACEEQAQKSVASELRPVELEEPEVDTIILDIMEQREEEPGQVHSHSICEEQTTNLIKNRLESPEMEEPKVDCVELDKEMLCQEENPADLENCSQNTRSCLEGEAKKINLGEPDGSAADLEKVDCGKEPYQLQTEPVTEEKVETLELRELVKLEGKNECQEEDHTDVRNAPQGQEQTTRTLEIDMVKLQVEDQEVTFEQDNKPSQFDGESACEDLSEQDVESSGLQEKKECQEESIDQVEREPEAGPVMLAEVKGCHEDKSNQMEQCPGKEECQEEDSDRLSTDIVCEDTEKEKLEMGDPDAGDVLLDNEELQEEETDRVCDSSEGDRYTARSVEKTEKLKVENSVFEEEKPSKEERPDFAENEAEKSEEGIPEVEIVKLDNKESQNEKPDQRMGGSVSEEHSADIEEHDIDKLQASQPELEGTVALDERNECLEEIPDAIDHKSAGEIEILGEEPIALEGKEECYSESKHRHAVDNTGVSEAQMVESAENENEKPEIRIPKVEDLLDKMEHQNEEHGTSFTEDVQNETENAEVREPEVKETIPAEARNTSVCKEHATDSKEDDIDKFEVNQPEVGMPDQLISSTSVSTAHVADFVENETEKPEMEVPAVEDNVRDKGECHSDISNPDESSSVCEESMTDSRDEFELSQPKVEKLDEVIVGTTSMSEAHTLDLLKNETEKSEVGMLEVENNKESHSEKPDQDRSSTVCEENAIDLQEHEVDKFEMNQPDIVANSLSVHETCMLEPLENGTEKAEKGAPQGEGIAEEQKECICDKPYQDESSSVDEVHVTEFKEDDVDKLEVNLPAVGKPDQVIPGSISTVEAHTVPEEANVPEQKKCLDPKTDRDEGGSVHEEHSTEKDDVSKPEVNQPGVEEPDEVITLRSVSETDTLDSPGNGTEKPEEETQEVEDDMLEQKECLGEKPDQATEPKEDKMEKPEEKVAEEGMPDVEYNMLPRKEHLGETSDQATDSKEDEMKKLEGAEDIVLEQKECLGEKPDQRDSSSVFQAHETEYKADGKDKLEVEQPPVDASNQITAGGTSVGETQGVDSLMGETKKPEGVLEVDVHLLVPEECLEQTTEQDENTSLSEEYVAESIGDDINKLEMNQLEVKESHQAIVSSTPVSETCKADSQETRPEKNEELPEIEDNVLEEKVGEKPYQDETSSVFEENATDSKEEDMDKLKVGLPQPDQDMLLEEGECLGEKPDQEESSSVCEGHAIDSKEDVGDNLEAKLPESDQVITSGASVCEHTPQNARDEPKVGVPAVKGDGLASVQDFSTNENVQAVESDLLSITQDGEQTSIHDFSTDEDVQAAELSDLPTEDKQEKEFEQEPGHSQNANTQLHDPSSPRAMTKSNTEENDFTQNAEISDAPKPPEGTEEILEDQEVHQMEESDLSQGTQKHESEKVDTAMPLTSISATQEEDNLNLTTGDREAEAKEIQTLMDKQTSQCQGISLPTLALAVPQAPQEAIPADGGVETPTMQSSSADIKDTLVGIKELKDETHEQQSPQPVLDQQESPTEKEKAYSVQEVAATQYQLDNAELSSEREVDTTTLETDQINSKETQLEQREARKEVAALVLDEEQPNFKVESQESCTECDMNTLNVLCKELAPTETDYNPKEMKMIPETSGDSNQMDCEARNITEVSKSQTTAEIDASMNEQINAVGMPNENIELKPQSSNEQNSTEPVNLHQQEIHTQEAPILSLTHQMKLAGINDVKGALQTVKETSAAPEEHEEPAKNNFVKQQPEEQKPENLGVKAEDATDKELAYNQIIPILSSEEVWKPEDGKHIQFNEAFQSLPTPVMACSTPSNLLPLPLPPSFSLQCAKKIQAHSVYIFSLFSTQVQSPYQYLSRDLCCLNYEDDKLKRNNTIL
ncbi:hypothetical protein GOP47_0018856 [Adiantum capillus-veneris]|uniref:Uncharacterized protein n=1 Tax=Adiantum capillus-veneris TaxID=13818 RepID=A0A9D4ZA05_ADICA|nr:hypothetical protein GOP47_0018856 [Adiantum capillus-veneris]